MVKRIITQKRTSEDFRVLFLRMLLIAIALIIWEVLAQGNERVAFYTSYPSAILKDLLAFSENGEVYRHVGITLKEAYLGLFYGSVIGIAMGVFLSQFKLLGRLFVPIISAFQSIPQLTLAPLYILWFGIGLKSKVVLSALMVFFNVFSATYNGIRDIDQRLIESALLLGAKNRQILWHIVIPTSMPWIFSGIKIGANICMVGAIISEYIGASGGLGWMITYASSFFQINRVMTCIMLLLIIGLIVNALLAYIEKRLLKWRSEVNLSIHSDYVSE